MVWFLFALDVVICARILFCDVVDGRFEVFFPILGGKWVLDRRFRLIRLLWVFVVVVFLFFFS